MKAESLNYIGEPLTVQVLNAEQRALEKMAKERMEGRKIVRVSYFVDYLEIALDDGAPPVKILCPGGFREVS